MIEGYAEYSSEDRFRELLDKSHVDDVDVDTIVEAAQAAFSEVIGLSEGVPEVWNQTTLPNAMKVYPSTPLKLGRRLLEIIEEAGSQRGSDATVEYLKGAISQAEVEFSNSDKKAHSEKLRSDIESFISEYAARYGENYKGVVAVIIWGSYARFDQRLDSDIDFATVSFDDPDGFLRADLWVSTDDFEEVLMNRLDKTRDYSIDMQDWGRGAMNDEQSIRKLISLESPYFLVASPFPEVKDRVQRLLQEEIRNGLEE